MNLGRVVAVLESSSEESIRALLDDYATVFFVDWKENDDAIPDGCESILETGHLSGELGKTDSEHVYEIYVRYRDRRMKVPLTYSLDDGHITLCALNKVLS